MHKPARRQTGAPWRCRSGCRGLHPDGIERDNAAARRAAQGCARAREDTGNSKRRRSVGMPGAPARRGGYGAAVAPMRKGKARTPRTLSVSRWALIAQAGAALPAWDSNWRMTSAEKPHRNAKAWRRASSTPTACGVVKLRSECSMAAPWQKPFMDEGSVRSNLPQSVDSAREMIRKVMQR
ncbi:hypothetical protein D3C71_1582720 [compost metagenome]